MLDLLLTNARIVDGTGNPWRKGCVGVRDGRIVAVGSAHDMPEARTVLDIGGNILCPGFIDSHSHSDLRIIDEPLALPKIMQGITTENVGLDSMSVAPISDKNKEPWSTSISGLDGVAQKPWGWNGFASYLNALDAAKPSVNLSSYVGLGTVRLDVMGMEDRPPTAEELRLMEESVARCMEEGARGISAGLIYTPNKYQSTEELVALAKVAARYDGILDVHMRNEADHMAEALEEVIHIGRETGIRILVTHFKLRGRRNWGNARRHLDTIDRARGEGIDIGIAQYPYTANSTFMHVVVPPWYHSRGTDGLLKALAEEREQVKKDMLTTEGWENFSQVMGWENIYVSSVASEKNLWCEGKSAVALGEALGKSPEDAVLDLLIEENLAVGLLGHGMCEEDVMEGMKHPTMCLITDGLLSGGKPHPRTYAAFPRFIARYVREKRLLTLEEAVRKMTSSTALKLRMKRKGFIMPGMDADMVVFGENRIRDVNTFENPRVYPEGIDYVLGQRRDRRRSRRPYGRASRQDHTRLTMPPTVRPFPIAGDGRAVFSFFKEETSMSYSPTLGSVFNRTKMRDPSHVCSFSGMCAMCTADCIGSCEIGLSAVRGMETVYPTTTGENQIASEKVYPVDYSHFNINGRSFGAMGAPLDADRATIYHVGLEREIGTLNPVKLALPIILPALIKLNWPDYFGGAAMAGVNAVIGEGAVSKDPTLAYENGKVVHAPKLREMLDAFNKYDRDTGRLSFRPTMTTTRRACRSTPSGNAGPRPSNSSSGSPPRARSPRTSSPRSKRR